ncbi:MFS transporter [Carboxydochorda subterranea]|uniref:MFS transporter n=1 Tax=Carboxydichorda subterranea TaxID=3109565 RepID=A0ABZ1C1H3_9FIRM|nr:MFS transporter [Limnochorda sp. L945t]WRP18172.1 MFS transporter [Limnochorda sp. L945t]
MGLRGAGRWGAVRAGALSFPAFRSYLAAQGISLIGTWMQGAAQAWLVLQLTGSAVKLGTVSAVQSLPVLFFSLPAGTIADHANRRKMLILTQSALAACAAVLGVLTVLGWVRYWHVVVIAGIYGVFNTLDMPGRNAFLGDMVPREALASAIGLHSTIFNLARIVGPGVAGLVVAAVGSGPAFLLNALSFVPVIGVLAGIRIAADRTRPPGGALGDLLTPSGMWRPVMDGLRYARATRPIRQGLLLLGIVSLFSMNFQVLTPVYASRALGQGASGYGLLMSSLGVGALVAAAGLASERSAEPPAWRRSAGVVLLGLGLAGLAVCRWYLPALALMALTGWGMVSLSVGTNAMVQLNSEERMRGRVMSLYTLVLVGVAPIGSMLAGAVADHAGVGTAWAMGGGVALAAFAWLRPWEIRAVTRRTELPAAGVAAGGRGQESLPG